MNYYESLSYCGEEGEPIRAHFVMMEGQRIGIDCAGDTVKALPTASSSWRGREGAPLSLA